MLLAVGCSKKSAMDHTSAPEAAGDTPAEPGDDLSALEQQLAQRESQLQAVGVGPRATTRDFTAVTSAGGDASSPQPPADADPTPSTAPAPVAPKARPEEEVGRCEQVCDISAAICELEGQICGLLPRHPGEARYQTACDRAAADCRLANEACNACNAS